MKTISLEERLRAPNQFRTIHELSAEGRPARAVATPTREVVLILGGGERLAVPCLSVERFEDRVEVVNVDGTTHRFSLAEVA